MQAIIKLIFLFVFLAIISNAVIAATIYGNIYDLSLSKVLGASVEVNTTPQQYFVSKDGSYSFDIPNGFYIIKAELRNNGIVAFESRNISVNQEGNYVIDLILFPSFEEEDDISQDIEITIPETEEKSFASLFALILVFVIGAIVYFIFKGKKEKKSNEENKDTKETLEDSKKYLDKIVDIIEKEAGRTTQKQIRKEIPLSEAKISLMIAELEYKGVIEKIKKGRGNIIILKRK